MKLDVVCVCCTRGALISHAAEGMDINGIDFGSMKRKFQMRKIL
jgi:hypothetical protein